MSNFCSQTNGTSPFLECAIYSTEFQAAFSSVTNGGTIAITANDEESWGRYGGAGVLVPECDSVCPGCVIAPNSSLSYQTTHHTAVVAEYQRMTAAIYATQNAPNTDKTFVIDNWETDNQLYFSPGSYATAIHAGLGAPSNGPDSPCMINARREGLTKWFQNRQEGIVAGTPANVTTGVKVLDAIEITGLRLFLDLNLTSTLKDIVPQVRPAYVTYSAWDSTKFRGGLDEDIAYIELQLSAIAATHPITHARPYLGLGELGILYPTGEASLLSTPQDAWRYRETAKAAYRARVAVPSGGLGSPLIILWQAFTTYGWRWATNPFSSSDFAGWNSSLRLDVPPYPVEAVDGLFTADGDERSFSKSLRSALAQYATSGIFLPQPVAIQSIVDRGVSGTQHYFELYGTFPTGSYTAAVVCDGNATAASGVTRVNATQVNLNIANPGGTSCDPAELVARGVYCTFEVIANSVQRSPIIGPRHVCPSVTYGVSGLDWLSRCQPGLETGSCSYPTNIAPNSTATGSSQFSSAFAPSKAIDTDVNSEWASNHELTPSITLTWSSAKTIKRVVLMDRVNTTDKVKSGILYFSDGAAISVGELPDDGTPIVVNFRSRTVTWVRFSVTTGQGANVGLKQIEVY